MLHFTFESASINIENKPVIPIEKKFEIINKADGFCQLIIHYGFTEAINVPKTLDEMPKIIKLPVDINKHKLVYFVEIISVETTREKIKHMWRWQKYLFSLMLRNAVPDIQFYCLPYNKSIALGAYHRF